VQVVCHRRCPDRVETPRFKDVVERLIASTQGPIIKNMLP
jgi:hypothetical protein